MTTRRDFLKTTALVTVQGIGVHLSHGGFPGCVVGGNNLPLGPEPIYLGYPAKHWVETLLTAATPQDKNAAFGALSALSEAAIPSMLDALPGAAAEMQKTLIRCLGSMDQEALPVLLQLTEHPSAQLRATACEALGKRTGERALPNAAALREFARILEMLEQSPPVDHAAVEGRLEQLSVRTQMPRFHAEACEALRRRLGDSALFVRCSAVESLDFLHQPQHTPSPSIVEAMVRLGLGGNNQASCRAAYWLDLYAPPECSVPPQRDELQRILTALDDSDTDIQRPAMSLLSWLRSTGAVQINAIVESADRGELSIGPRASCKLLAMSADLTPRLLERLKDLRPEVRKYAIGAIHDACRTLRRNEPKCAEARSALDKMIDDPDPDVVLAALDEIDGPNGSPGSETIAALYVVINHPNGLVRARVRYALLMRIIWQQPGERSLDLVPVIMAAIQSGDPRTQTLGFESLERLSEQQRKEFAPIALKYIADENDDLRRAAMTALSLCDGDLAASTVSQFANQILAESEAGKVRIQPSERGSFELRLVAGLHFCELLSCTCEITVAERYRPLAVSFLMEALNDVNHQEAAIRLLGKFGRDAQVAAPALLTLFKSREDSLALVRTHYIVDTLAAIVPPQEALPYLLQILADEPHTLPLCAIGEWIAEIGPAADQAVPRLIEITKRSPDSQWAAFSMLGKIGLPAMDALRPLLRHENPAFREAAIRAVGHMDEHGRPIVHELFPALNDPDVAVRVAAAEAIQRIRAASGEVARRLLAALNDPCPSVVQQVQQALWWELIEMSRGRMRDLTDDKGITKAKADDSWSPGRLTEFKSETRIALIGPSPWGCGARGKGKRPP